MPTTTCIHIVQVLNLPTGYSKNTSILLIALEPGLLVAITCGYAVII